MRQFVSIETPVIHLPTGASNIVRINQCHVYWLNLKRRHLSVRKVFGETVEQTIDGICRHFILLLLFLLTISCPWGRGSGFNPPKIEKKYLGHLTTSEYPQTL